MRLLRPALLTFILIFLGALASRFFFISFFETLPFSISFYDQYDSGQLDTIYGVNDSLKYEYAVQVASAKGPVLFAYWHQSFLVLFLESSIRTIPLLGAFIKSILITSVVLPLISNPKSIFRLTFAIFIIFYLLLESAGPSKDFWTFISLFYLFLSFFSGHWIGLFISLFAVFLIRPNVFFVLITLYILAKFAETRVRKIYGVSRFLIPSIVISSLVLFWFSSKLIYGIETAYSSFANLFASPLDISLKIAYAFLAPLPMIPVFLGDLRFSEFPVVYSFQVLKAVLFLLSSILPFATFYCLRLFSGSRYRFGVEVRASLSNPSILLFILLMILAIGSSGYVLRSIQLFVGSFASACLIYFNQRTFRPVSSV